MSHTSLKGLQQLAIRQSAGSAKIPKQAVLYLRKPDTQYQCQDCTMFIAGSEQCSIHGPEDQIRAIGSCGFFVKGMPMPDMKPMGEVTTQESGYVESQPGFSCKRCRFFLPGRGDCQAVDKDSPGDDPHRIHADACCNNWKSLA